MSSSESRDPARIWPSMLGCALVGTLLQVGCGGGGGGDEPEPEPEPELLDLYAFNFFSPQDRPLTAAFSTEDEGTVRQHALRITHPAAAAPGINGTFDTVTEAFTVSTGSTAVFTDVGTDPFIGSYTVTVTQSWQLPPDGAPTAGTLEVSLGEAVITVAVDASLPGVRLTLDTNGDGTADEGPVALDWTQFEALDTNGSAPDWQLAASFGYLTSITFVTDQIGLVLTAFEQIDDDLKTNNPLVRTCDRFSDANLAAPAGLPDAGTSSFGWSDTSANGDIGAGDSFEWTFDQCWSDDPVDNVDEVRDGTVDFDGYTEVVDEDSVITRIGFEGGQQGVSFTSLALSETVVSSGSNVPALDLTATLNGSFILVFFAP